MKQSSGNLNRRHKLLLNRPHAVRVLSGLHILFLPLILVVVLLCRPGAAGAWVPFGPGGGVSGIAIVNTNPETVYAATYQDGVWKKVGNGTWTEVNNGLTMLRMECIAAHPTEKQTLYAGTFGGGLFKTVDGGDTWVQVLPTGNFYTVFVDPVDTNAVYTGGESGVFKSVDDGATWHVPLSGEINTLAPAITRSAPGTLYAGGMDGISKTTNGGKSWTSADHGIAPDDYEQYGIWSLAIDRSAPETIYASCIGGVYKSTDGGQNWSMSLGQVGSNYGYHCVAIDPSNPRTVYAGAWGNGVYVTYDGGAKWQRLEPATLPPDPDHQHYSPIDWINQLAIDPAGSGAVYAGTSNHGIYVQPGTPGAPTNVSAKAQGDRFIVSFDPPSLTGGAPIVSYTVNPILKTAGGKETGYPSIQGTTSPISIAGTALREGYDFYFIVKATNSGGKTGRASAPSNLVEITVPGAPSGVQATPWNKEAAVGFTPPASDGGSTIVFYEVTSSPGGITKTGTNSPITVNGLTNGVSYSFKVRAHNSVGGGPWSTPSAKVTPADVPGAPTDVTATRGNGSATIHFVYPVTGGSPITTYSVTSSPGNITRTGKKSPITFGGLINGTAYTFTVYAVNEMGMGPPSTPSNSVIPATVPGAPVKVAASGGNGQATVSFLPPFSTGGSPITSYTVTSSPGGITKTGTGSPITVTGLTNGTSYRFSVEAVNDVGAGAASALSNAVIPVGRIPGLEH